MHSGKSLSEAQQRALVEALGHPRRVLNLRMAKTGEALKRNHLAVYAPPAHGRGAEWRLSDEGVRLARTLADSQDHEVPEELDAPHGPGLPESVNRDLNALRTVENRLRRYVAELDSTRTPERLQSAAVAARIWDILGDAEARLVRTDTLWTDWRASILLALPERADKLLGMAVEGGGWADRSALGNGIHRNCNMGTVRRAVAHGARLRCWPADIDPPIAPVYESSRQRALLGYQMQADLVPVFRAALAENTGIRT
ncbi:hypothetical protein [Kitasatospora sp. NPDC088783]|uniref:hypothetical protein n=1 Tax=Kitasatospora sp. NPDC088783 TaxID=3364077 RepID=UPI00382FF438